MAHFTLSIPDDLFENMKRHPEIKWSEIVRQTITLYLQEIKDVSSSKDISNLLSKNTLESLSAISSKKAAMYNRRSAKEEWKRARSLTRTF